MARAVNRSFDSLEEAVAVVRRLSPSKAENDDRTLYARGTPPVFPPSSKAALLHAADDDGSARLVPVLTVAEAYLVIDDTLERWPNASNAELVGAIAYYAFFDAWPDTAADVAPFLTPPGPLSTASGCACADYRARPEVHREAIAEVFTALLSPLATHPERGVSLFTCPTCARSWQDRYAGGFLFEVPPLPTSDWLAEPWADIVEWKDYEDARATFLAQNATEERGDPCRRPNCDRRSIPLSVLCAPHHWETNANVEPPKGRALPPRS